MMVRVINGVKYYMRVCRRCGEIYHTSARGSKVCRNCELQKGGRWNKSKK